jgi:hypothetical protein
MSPKPYGPPQNDKNSNENGGHGRTRNLCSNLLLDDSLVKLVLECTTQAHRHPTIEDYILAFRAKNDLHPQVQHLPHPAAQLLHSLYNYGATETE